MRGFKRDNTETIARQFLDDDSFVSLPKHTHGDEAMQHEILYGEDKGFWREKVYQAAHGICEVCGNYAPLHGEEGYAGCAHHKLHKPAERCDCVENGGWRCGRFIRDCHTREHAAPQFTRRSDERTGDSTAG